MAKSRINSSHMLLGAGLLLIGALMLLRTTGLINLGAWEWFGTLWPVGLVLAGVSFILKSRISGFIFLALTIILGGLYLADQFDISNGDPRTIVQDIPFEDEIGNAELELNFGAGDISIVKGSEDYLVKNTITTANRNDPEMQYLKEGSEAKVTIDRDTLNLPFQSSIGDTWDLELNPLIEYNLHLNHGASELDADLTGLKVRSLDIDSGATDILIRFDSPALVNIDTGASDIELEFPKGSNVKISVDGGMVSYNMEGFTKINSTYYSEEYDENAEGFEVTIDAGATNVEARFYEVGE